MTGSGLRNPAELPGRLGLSDPPDLLLIDAPAALAGVLSAARPGDKAPVAVAERELRSVKARFAAVLLWRESRIGSRAALDDALRRLEPGGVLWVVVAARKVIGPETPAAHRLNREDLRKALEPAGLTPDREVRVSAWHVAYRFTSTESRPGGKEGDVGQ